jgi:hypothetical protein
VLKKWIVYLIIAWIGALIITGAGMFYLIKTTDTEQQNVQTMQAQLQSQNLAETQKNVDSISNNVKLTLQILSKEILFSKLLTQLGSVLPANTTLQDLQIDKLQGGINITARAKDITSATQVQVNFSDPKNNIFEKADIENISCDQNANNKTYPCTVQIRALFKKDNPFLYISSGSKTTDTKAVTP